MLTARSGLFPRTRARFYFDLEDRDMRVDAIGMLHKGVRALLFDAIAAAGRVDVASSAEVDALDARVERALLLVEEHRARESRELLRIVRVLDDALADRLQGEDSSMERAHEDVRRAMLQLAAAAPDERTIFGYLLQHCLHRATAEHLSQMNHRETVVAAVLAGNAGEGELTALRDRIFAGLSSARPGEWQEILLPVVNSAERLLVSGSIVGLS